MAAQPRWRLECDCGMARSFTNSCPNGAEFDNPGRRPGNHVTHRPNPQTGASPYPPSVSRMHAHHPIPRATPWESGHAHFRIVTRRRRWSASPTCAARAPLPEICRPLRNNGPQTPITDHHICVRSHVATRSHRQRGVRKPRERGRSLPRDPPPFIVWQHRRPRCCRRPPTALAATTTFWIALGGGGLKRATSPIVAPSGPPGPKSA